MAVAGNEEKEIIKQKILEVFPNSFIYDKDIRIPLNGRQIKVTLTCAKVNVESGSDTALPTAGGAQPASVDANPHLSETEKKEVNDLLDSLGL